MQTNPSAAASGAALQQQEMLARWAAQETRYGLIFLDPSGCVTGMSSAAERVLGYLPGDLMGRSLSTIFTRGDQVLQLPLHEMQVALSVGFSEDDRWHRRKDGSLVWIGGSLTRLQDASGQVCGYVKVLRDRTERRTQIESLTNRLAQSQREQAELGERMRAAARAIASSCEALSTALSQLPTALGGTAARHHDSIKAQLRVQQGVVEELRRVGPGATAPTSLRLETVQLQQLLADVAGACSQRAVSAGVQLELLAPAGAIELQADPQRLRQAVTNLVANAIAFTPADGRVWLKATLEAESAVIRVEDTGVGIDGHLLPRIMAIFTGEEGAQVPLPAAKETGLRAAHRLVLLHGGTMELRSDGKDKGCDVGVRLPVAGPPHAANVHPQG